MEQRGVQAEAAVEEDEQKELEARMRRALATKENPLSDSESTSERLRRLEREGAPSAESSESAGDPENSES